MPDFNSNIFAREGKLGSAGLVNPVQYQANVRFAQATVTVPSSLTANDRLFLVTLPQGAQPIPSMSQAICHADPGTTLVLDVGYASDVDALAEDIVLSSGGVVPFTGTQAVQPAQTRNRSQLTTETTVFATVVNAASITNNSTITFLIAYLVG